MGRYDSSVRCAQIRELIEEKQYLEAMEEIEELRFEEVPTITDLYLFADLFLKAEKMDIAKNYTTPCIGVPHQDRPCTVF